MKAELRADGLHISGYVNVPGRQSRPVMTKRGKVIEVIEQRAFQKAIDSATNGVRMLLDHNPDRVLASTSDKSLNVFEDEIGLHAEALVTDQEVIEGAKAGKLRGWSFNMRNIVDSVEERAGELPIRHVQSFDMDEITLVMHRMPCYSATSIEIRADVEEDVEERASAGEIRVIIPEDKPEDPMETYRKRLSNLKKEGKKDGN